MTPSALRPAPRTATSPGARVTARVRRSAAALLLTGALSGAALLGPAATAFATPGSADSAGGWLRLAHFSPGAPAVDVYLYPFGGSKPAMVLKHVSYGTASPYQSVDAGQYTVAMRKAGAGDATPPVISSTVRVTKGRAYTVAGLGPGSALELRTLEDQLSAPKGQSGVRIIQASLNQPSVSVRLSSQEASKLRFPTSTPYRTVPSGTANVRVTAGSASASHTVLLSGRSTHTLVVLSATGSTPKLLDLTDSAGPNTQPQGGVEAGLGGLANDATASRPGPEQGDGLGGVAVWGAAAVLGAGGAAFAVRRLRRS